MFLGMRFSDIVGYRLDSMILRVQNYSMILWFYDSISDSSSLSAFALCNGSQFLLTIKSLLKRMIVHRLEHIGGELKEDPVVMDFLFSFFISKR